MLYRRLRLAMSAAAALTAAPALAGETRGYVVDFFYFATSYTQSNCPDGLNVLSDEFFKRELRRLGYPNSEVENLMKDFPNGGYIPITTMRGRINGQPVNVYSNPTTVPDPHIKTVKGNVAYGFNLDGKDGANDFIDPETHERGVDNQYYRAVGCIQNFAVKIPDVAIAPYVQWDLSRDAAAAWVVEIRGIDDPRNDDDVTVILDKSMDISPRDVTGHAVKDLTMRVDPDSRSRNVVHGRIKDGVLTTDAFDMSLVADPTLMPNFKFRNAKLRFKLRDDGNIEGFLGGYQPWQPIYWTFAQGGWIIEHAQGIDMPGLYNALKHMADANPDPKSGDNTDISSTYWIGAVPAIIRNPQAAKTAAK